MRIAGRVNLSAGKGIYQKSVRPRIGTGFAVTKQDGIGRARKRVWISGTFSVQRVFCTGDAPSE
jgi:hypothetical protein